MGLYLIPDNFLKYVFYPITNTDTKARNWVRIDLFIVLSLEFTILATSFWITVFWSMVGFINKDKVFFLRESDTDVRITTVRWQMISSSSLIYLSCEMIIKDITGHLGCWVTKVFNMYVECDYISQSVPIDTISLWFSIRQVYNILEIKCKWMSKYIN